MALVAFVVGCFLTEALPLPMVAFCIGIFALLAGVVNREAVAGLYWSDATWFIMGSLMFAAAFVKTGVDRRIALMMFGKLKNPSIKMITMVIILIISPLTMFMSDHALAAMFLPIGIMLYDTTCSQSGQKDPELGKMLMITIAMACNLGGSLAPSGAARNIIMMSYVEDMFGVNIGFGQWCIYAMPYLVMVVPITWLVINWRFRPVNTNLGPAINNVKQQIAKGGGGWTRQQIVSVSIFVVMMFCWITEKNLLYSLTGIRFGIGVLAVMGAVAYILAGVVNWRDYQTKVDWGVVWLYAGAIIFGKVLVETGGAFWIAKTIVTLTAPLGLGSGMGLLLSGNVITGILTQLMADGPACARRGPGDPGHGRPGAPGDQHNPLHRHQHGHGLVPGLLSDHRNAAQRHCLRQRLSGAKGLHAGRTDPFLHQPGRHHAPGGSLLELDGLARTGVLLTVAIGEKGGLLP